MRWGKKGYAFGEKSKNGCVWEKKGHAFGKKLKMDAFGKKNIKWTRLGKKKCLCKNLFCSNVCYFNELHQIPQQLLL